MVFTSASLLPRRGPVPTLTVLGELTAGVHFFTSALQINARHAGVQARGIVAAIAGTPQAQPEVAAGRASVVRLVGAV